MSTSDPITEILKGMGRKPSELLSACMSEVSSVRNSVIRYSRIITLAPFVKDKLFKDVGVQFPNSYESYVFKPDELPSFLGFSQMTQNTGFFLCFVNEHPEVLAKAVLSKLKSADFLYLVHCAIPAIFGFFSSQEHFEIAIKFYQAIIAGKCDQEKANIILSPLMCSVVTYRFLEVVFTQFTDFLAINGNKNNNQSDNFVKMFSEYFVECISHSLKLLPQPLLDLLQSLRENQWDNLKFGDLFFKNFLWKYAKIFTLSSPARNQYQLLQKIIYYTSKSDDLISIIYKELFQCRSYFDLPSIYQPFSHLYLNFYVSVHDIQSVAQLLHSCKMMPETVTLKELKRVPEEYSFHWYSCQAFPHVTFSANNNCYEPIFDTNSQEKKILELLLNNTMYKKELENWNDLIGSCTKIVINSFIEEAIQQPISKTFMKTYRMIKKSFDLPILNRKIFLTLIEKNLSNWIGDKLEVFNHLDQQFHMLLEHIDRNEKMIDYSEFASSIHKSLRPAMRSTFQKLHYLEFAPMSDQFELLIESIKKFEFILDFEHCTEEKSRSIYPIILQQSNDMHFFSIFIKLNSFAMKNETFLELCSDYERKLWLKIEMIILRCLKTDPTFLKAYTTLYNVFIQTAEEKTKE